MSKNLGYFNAAGIVMEVGGVVVVMYLVREDLLEMMEA